MRGGKGKSKGKTQESKGKSKTPLNDQGTKALRNHDGGCGVICLVPLEASECLGDLVVNGGFAFCFLTLDLLFYA